MGIIASNGLPNYMREQLIQAGHTEIARVYDALIMLRWEIGKAFTEAELLGQLKQFKIGRRALRKALESAAFEKLADSRVTGGRPAKLYAARSIGEIERQMYIAPDVFPSQAHRHPAMETDRIDPEDLSHGGYRRALHREVIRRRQGMGTARSWHSARLKVCARTLRRWEKILRIRVERVVEYHVLTASMVAELNADLGKHRHTWLQAFGRRFRATQHTAAFLLEQTIDVVAARQLPNKYYLY